MNRELLTLDEIKLVELNVLRYVKETCEKNNLKYYLAFGTLLGAIRHGGFIPWDDDIDIFMPVEDLNKLINIIKNDNTKYKILSNSYDHDYQYAFSKVIDCETIVIEDNVENTREIGIWIDIFPLFEVSKEKSYKYTLIKVMDKCRAASLRRTLPSNKYNNIKPIAYLCWKICKMIGPKFFLNNISKLLKYSFSLNGDYYMAVETIVQYGGVFKKEIFGKGSPIRFEHEFYFAPDKPELYLEQTYGNYMKLPPEHKRVSHKIIAFYK